ncbi:MAG: sugar ABC transporter ATP-binding protein [Bacteroidetes bacterium]|nr:sugar ABC transporter ATP-binding protein [Bacteroidota bacterium]
MPSSRLETISLCKDYPGTKALHDVSVRFDGGQVHALIGKNGAGKSTLVKIFAGAISPTSGSVLINGKSAAFSSPRDALRQGIVAVYQELSLVPELTVAENILLGRMPHRRGLWKVAIDWERAYATAQAVLTRLGVELDVKKKVRAHGIAQKQFVEIAKAMSYNPAVLMLDEPTSALSYRETERLFELLRTLAAQGVVLLYITHRLQEIYEIADAVSVLRDGKLVGTVEKKEASPERLAKMMFGDVIKVARRSEPPGITEPLMTVDHLSRGTLFRDVSLTLHKGEVLGIAGLLGSGRTELLRSIFGADPPDGGHLMLDGRRVYPKHPALMKRLGIVLTPEDRKEEGLIQILSTRANICLASLQRVGTGGFTTRRRDRAWAEPLIRTVGVVTKDVEAPVSSLSGGNQQKVVVAKWVGTEPKVILMDEPTRGIDVQAKRQVFEIVWALSKRGIGSLVVSSELEELLEVCHRILIMRKGRIVSEVLPSETSLERLFSLCLQ